jgi:hypothetical protein
MGQENAEGMAHVGVRLTDQLGDIFLWLSLKAHFAKTHAL